MMNLVSGVFSKAQWKCGRVRLVVVASVLAAAIPLQLIIEMGEGSIIALLSMGTFDSMLLLAVCVAPVVLFCLIKANKSGSDQVESRLWQQSAVTGFVVSQCYLGVSLYLLSTYLAPAYMNLPAF